MIVKGSRNASASIYLAISSTSFLKILAMPCFLGELARSLASHTANEMLTVSATLIIPTRRLRNPLMRGRSY